MPVTRVRGSRGGGSGEGGWFGDTATVLHSARTRRRSYPLGRRTIWSLQTRGRREGVVVIVSCTSLYLNVIRHVFLESH